MYFRFLSVALVILALAGPVLAEPIQVKIKAETVSGSESRAIVYLGKLFEERSGGRLQIETLTFSEEKQGLQAVRANNIQLLLTAASDLDSLFPLVKVLGLPFLYRDREDLHQVLDGEIGAQILDTRNDQGLIALSYWDRSFLQLAGPIPLLDPQQLQDVRFQNPSSLLASLANGRRTGFSEKSDITETTLDHLIGRGEKPGFSDLTLSGHAATGDLLITNREFWTHLPEDLKVIVQGAIQDTRLYVRELVEQAEQKQLKMLEESGTCRLHYLSDHQKEAWRKTLLPVYRQLPDISAKRIVNTIISR